MSIIYENFPSRVCHSRLVLAKNEKIDDNLICGICQEIVFKPEECVTCQNVFCGECVQKWREKKNICPMTCPAPFKTVGPHKLLRKALGDLKYKCSSEFESSHSKI